MEKRLRWFIGRSFLGMLIWATMMNLSAPPSGWAMLAPVEAPRAAASIEGEQKQEDMREIQTALESKVLRHRLAELKLPPEQIDQRLAQLSDAEIHQAATQIRSVNAGGDAITYVLVVGILVLLFVYLFRRV